MLCPICRKDLGNTPPEGGEGWQCGACGWGQQAGGQEDSSGIALAVTRGLGLLLQTIGVLAVGAGCGYVIYKSSLLILVAWPTLGCLSVALVVALCPYAKEWFVVLMATVMHSSLFAFGVAGAGGHTFFEGLGILLHDLFRWDSGVKVLVLGWFLQVALGVAMAWYKER